MYKKYIILGLFVVFILSGCINKEPTEKSAKIIDAPLASIQQTKTEEIKMNSKSVEYIDFEAVAVTFDNWSSINAEFGASLDQNILDESTKVVLVMDNHRTDLSTFDFKSISTLDGVVASNWEQLSLRMGGHHVGGVLTFSKSEKPEVLKIDGLPVGDVVINI